MTELRSILTATDFSDGATHAALRAALVGIDTRIATGMLLHVLDQSWLDSLRHLLHVPPAVSDGVVGEAERRLSGLAEDVRQHLNFAFTTRLHAGSVVEGILAAATAADLLVVGARGAHPMRNFAIGTTAEHLLRRTRNPVLVVKRKPHGPYRRVLVAVDFSSHSAKALAYANAVAPRAALELMHVFDVPFEGKMHFAGVDREVIHGYRVRARQTAQSEMERFIAAAPPSANICRIIEHGYAPAKLLEKERELDADLIVVGKHGKSLMEELLLGSVTLHLLAESHCDVLVVRQDSKGSLGGS